jgi:hypothetical protein
MFHRRPNVSNFAYQPHLLNPYFPQGCTTANQIQGALSKSRDWPELASIEGDQPKPAQASASSIPPSKEAASAFHSGMKPLK